MFEFDFNKFSKSALSEIGNVLVKQSKSNMKKISLGRVYIIGGKAHIASKAGDAPNNLSGALSGSIRYEIKGNVLEFGAGDEEIDYAKFDELGTKKMGARPNYTKSILENKAKIDKLIENELIQSIRFKKNG